MTRATHETLQTASDNVHRECRSHHTPASPCHMLEEPWGIKCLTNAQGFLIRDGLPHSGTHIACRSDTIRNCQCRNCIKRLGNSCKDCSPCKVQSSPVFAQHNGVQTGVWDQQRNELARLPLVIIPLYSALYVLQDGQIPAAAPRHSLQVRTG
jgi:hypothetical protein